MLCQRKTEKIVHAKLKISILVKFLCQIVHVKNIYTCKTENFCQIVHVKLKIFWSNCTCKTKKFYVNSYM